MHTSFISAYMYSSTHHQDNKAFDLREVKKITFFKVDES
jgi:hypothetical protein